MSDKTESQHDQAATEAKADSPTEPTAAELAVERHADTVIRNNVYLAAAAGIIPLAFIDTAALFAIQLKLLRELAHVHQVSFRADLGKSAVGSLLASVAPTVLAKGVLGSGAFFALTNSLPVIGTVLRVATQPAFGAAFTYAIGKVFDRHFATGGDFLTFDADKAGMFFRTKFDEARGKTPKEPAPVPAAA